MALNGSGPISLGGSTVGQSINLELGYSATANISLNDSAVRSLLGVPSGSINLNQAHGKSNEFAYTISSNTADLNIRTALVSAGWNGSSKAIVTINAGVYIYASSTANAALTISGSFPNGITVNNAGTIVGMGGAGGAGTLFSAGNPGAAGGTALSTSVTTSFNNTGVIAGGGGGGGGGGSKLQAGSWQYGGGGGGGRTGLTASSGAFPYGRNGSVSSAGAGGSTTDGPVGGTGGTGGDWGSAGAAGAASTNAGGAGGASGYAVSGNSNITWIATGTRYGTIA